MIERYACLLVTVSHSVDQGRSIVYEEISNTQPSEGARTTNHARLCYMYGILHPSDPTTQGTCLNTISVIVGSLPGLIPIGGVWRLVFALGGGSFAIS